MTKAIPATNIMVTTAAIQRSDPVMEHTFRLLVFRTRFRANHALQATVASSLTRSAHPPKSLPLKARHALSASLASVVSTNAKRLGQADPLAKKVHHRGKSNTADYKKNDNDFSHTVIRKDLHPLDLQVAVQLVWHREHLGMIFSSLVLIAPDIQPRAHSVSFWSVRRCWMPSSKQLCWICRECAETVA